MWWYFTVFVCWSVFLHLNEADAQRKRERWEAAEPLCGKPRQNGPHSPECLAKLWELAKCLPEGLSSPQNLPGFSPWMDMAVRKVFVDMKKVRKGARKGQVDENGVPYEQKCFGNNADPFPDDEDDENPAENNQGRGNRPSGNQGNNQGRDNRPSGNQGNNQGRDNRPSGNQGNNQGRDNRPSGNQGNNQGPTKNEAVPRRPERRPRRGGMWRPPKPLRQLYRKRKDYYFVAPPGPIKMMCKAHADITFIMDASSSIEYFGKGSWNLAKEFVVDVAKSFQIAANHVRFSFIIFSNGVENYLDFNAGKSKSTVLQKAKDMPYRTGGTNTQGALNMARTEMHTPARGDRPGSPDVIIVMTDGASNIKKFNTIPEAQRCKDANMTLLVVGVTKRVNKWELRGIASHKDYVFEVDKFSKLKDTLEDLVAKSCRATDGDVVYVDDDDGADKNAPDILVPVCYSQADVVFVLDASSSIEKAKFGNWQLMKYLAGKLTKSLEFGNKGFRVSVILYSDDATIYFDLNEYSEKRPALDAIYNMEYLTGNTNTQKALNVLRTQAFTRNHGDRRRVTNIAVFMSDGASNVNTANTLPEAARAKSDGITIFSVGVGPRANDTEIGGIASEPDFVFHLNELSQIGKILMDVATKCCEFVRRRAQT